MMHGQQNVKKECCPHGLTVHQLCHFIIPNNAHNIKHVELLKQSKTMAAAPTCFGLQRNHHQGATAST
jgi:hypothetical protein